MGKRMNSSSNSRRPNKEGSIYYREDKKLWCASVQVGVDVHGKRKRKVIYAKSKDELIEKKKKLDASIVTGTYREPSKMTVEYFLDKWLNEICVSSLRPSTFNLYQGILRKHIYPAIGKILLCKLTPMQLQTLYNSKIKAGLSVSRVKHMHAIIHKALSHALKWGYVSYNVSDLVEKPKQRKKEMTVWNKEQVDKFLEAAKGDKFYPLYVLALTTGLRQGELLGLRWDDIDLRQGTVSVKRTVKEVRGKLVVGEPKTKSARRTVTLPKLAIEVLKEYRKQQLQKRFLSSGYVFTNTQGGLVRALNMVKRSFKPLIKKACVPEIRFHDLRHTHATLLLQQGVNPKLVQERLGHSSIGLTLDTYSHVLPNMQKQVAKELDIVFSM
ncbi:tyrosine-type recombinase/integrase [Capillibacterium thermochitinicola]|uniref:Site-specific integrase n=1 Tax=Capillibacterium thermochitinicola TaxID=2699427 RepID=A0A8J6HZE9_9FIRM|nr:site-specific integrase [Capillibacterium thermochitinicola]MBA2131964.1 site-specific integrase [Capillibacterium thermochitinicola]